MQRLAALALLSALALPALAMNRCITPKGGVIYTDESCESQGARPDRAVKGQISVVPLPPESQPPAAKKAAAGKKKPEPRRLASGMPVLAFCYDPNGARAEVRHAEVESAIRNAVSLWNTGCRVRFEFLGPCEAAARYEHQVDFRVRWVSFPDSMQIREGQPYREHAIAAANISFGIGLNRDIAEHKFARQWQRSVVHEFGHVAGVGHSTDPDDIMYPGSRSNMPTAADFAACNKAIAARYGVRAD